MNESTSSGRLSNRLLLAIAVISGLAAFFLIMRTPSVARIKVVAAGQTLAAADKISRGNLREASVSVAEYSNKQREFIPWSMVPLLEGRHVYKNVTSGTILTLDDLTSRTKSADDGNKPRSLTYLSTQVPSGMRAISIPCDAVTSFSYAIEPGDIIDVIQPLSSPQATAGVFGCSVLATGSRTLEGWIAPQNDGEKYAAIALLVKDTEVATLTQMFSGSYERPFIVLHRRES